MIVYLLINHEDGTICTLRPTTEDELVTVLDGDGYYTHSVLKVIGESGQAFVMSDEGKWLGLDVEGEPKYD